MFPGGFGELLRDRGRPGDVGHLFLEARLEGVRPTVGRFQRGFEFGYTRGCAGHPFEFLAQGRAFSAGAFQVLFQRSDFGVRHFLIGPHGFQLGPGLVQFGFLGVARGIRLVLFPFQDADTLFQVGQLVFFFGGAEGEFLKLLFALCEVHIAGVHGVFGIVKLLLEGGPGRALRFQGLLSLLCQSFQFDDALLGRLERLVLFREPFLDLQGRLFLRGKLAGSESQLLFEARDGLAQGDGFRGGLSKLLDRAHDLFHGLCRGFAPRREARLDGFELIMGFGNLLRPGPEPVGRHVLKIENQPFEPIPPLARV